MLISRPRLLPLTPLRDPLRRLIPTQDLEMFIPPSLSSVHPAADASLVGHGEA